MAPDTTTPRPWAALANREPRKAGPQPPDTAERTPDQGISAAQFAQSLMHLSRPRIELQAVGLKARRASPDDDLAWWEATMALDRALRRRGTGHEAATAARLASEAVLAAATRTGLAPGPDVNAVARSAGEVARALAVGNLSTAGVDYLTRGWEDLISPAGPSSPAGPAGGRGVRERPAAANHPTTARRL